MARITKIRLDAKKLGIYPHAEFLEYYLLLIDRLTNEGEAVMTSHFKRGSHRITDYL